MNGKLDVLGHYWNGSEKVYNFKALRVRRYFVRRALLEECKKQGVEMRFGMKCVGIEENSEKGVVVNFANGEKVTADFVVGADGIHSKIRKSFAPDTTPKYTGMMGVGGVIDRDVLPSEFDNVPLPAMVFAEAGSFALMPTDFEGKRIGFFISSAQQGRSREEWEKLANDKEQLYSILKKHAETRGWPDFVRIIAKTTKPESLSNWP